ncbi:hypothetical protein [Ruegeria atlantica]|uniref:hypothetical protein n=1 Tax=Ruegeria atlantica TaxID=81569 RepID=UPI00147C5D9D|nr:hypothetical protein [Ruegeria atlantica]
MDAKAKDPAMYGSKYARADADFYPTPPDLAHVLTIAPCRGLIDGSEVWEPCAGNHALGPALTAAGATRIHWSDAIDYGFADTAITPFEDALFPHAPVIVTNPPYSGDFPALMVNRCLEWMQSGKLESLLMLVRADWDLAKGRQGAMSHPAYAGAVRMCWRPYWTTNRTASPRHSYQWLLWSVHSVGHEPRHCHLYQARPDDVQGMVMQ